MGRPRRWFRASGAPALPRWGRGPRRLTDENDASQRSSVDQPNAPIDSAVVVIELRGFSAAGRISLTATEKPPQRIGAASSGQSSYTDDETADRYCRGIKRPVSGQLRRSGADGGCSGTMGRDLPGRKGQCLYPADSMMRQFKVRLRKQRARRASAPPQEIRADAVAGARGSRDKPIRHGRAVSSGRCFCRRGGRPLHDVIVVQLAVGGADRGSLPPSWPRRLAALALAIFASQRLARGLVQYPIGVFWRTPKSLGVRGQGALVSSDRLLAVWGQPSRRRANSHYWLGGATFRRSAR